MTLWIDYPELDMMRFPVSLLTAAALIEGIILALVDEYQQGDSSAISTPSTFNTDTSQEDIDLERAYQEVIPICNDVASVLGMPLVCLSTSSS